MLPVISHVSLFYVYGDETTHVKVAILFVNAAAAFFFKDRIAIHVPTRLESHRLKLGAQEL